MRGASLLQMNNYRPHEGLKLIKEYLNINIPVKSKQETYDYLKILSILSYPYIPNTAQHIWKKINLRGTPLIQSQVIHF